MSELRRGYMSPLGGAASSGPAGTKPGPPAEPGTREYEDLHATFRALGIDKPETKEEMVTAVKNILAGKNRTYNEIMTADAPAGYAMRSEDRNIPRLAPPSRLVDFLTYVGDLPKTIYHGFQDVLGDRMQKTTEQVGKEAYASLPTPTLLNR